MWRYGDGGDGPELHRSSFGVKVELLKIQKKDYRTKSKVIRPQYFVSNDMNVWLCWLSDEAHDDDVMSVSGPLWLVAVCSGVWLAGHLDCPKSLLLFLY